MELHQKLKCLRLLRGIRQSEVAETITAAKAGKTLKTHASVINRHESGEMVPRDKIICIYAQLYEVNKQWLNSEEAATPFQATLFRPICPYEPHVAATMGVFRAEMLTILPMFFKGIGFTDCTHLRSAVGSAFIMSTEAKRGCHAMILTNGFDLAANEALGKETCQTIDIDEGFYLELAINPLRRIKEAFTVAGINTPNEPDEIVPLRYQALPENVPPRLRVCFKMDDQHVGTPYDQERIAAIIRREFPRTSEIEMAQEAGRNWRASLDGGIKEYLEVQNWTISDDGIIRRG